MEEDPRLFTTVKNVLKDVDRQASGFRQYRQEQREKKPQRKTNLQMTAFSDCYVLSEIEPAWHVLAAVQALGIRLLTEGILTRGAVVQGPAYHNGRVLFGPGIVDAYRLEHEVAKYPRILVSESVRESVWEYHKDLWERELLKRDVDGCWFVNLLVPSASSWAPLSALELEQDRKAHLMKVRKSLTEAWGKVQGDPGRMSKVWWLIHRFNRVAEDEGLENITEKAS